MGTKRLGEHQYILYLFTKAHGLRAGMLGGVKSLGLQAALCTGSILMVNWQARLEEQLGRWTVKDLCVMPKVSSKEAAKCMLIGGLLTKALAWGEPEELLYQHTKELMQFDDEYALLFWANYNLWEKNLLAVSGFGLDCRVCVVTGEKEDLRYISPRSGKAVSEIGAGIYKPRLLPLPNFWQYEENSQISTRQTVETLRISDVIAGLKTTAHFLQRQNFLDKVLSTLRISMIKTWINEEENEIKEEKHRGKHQGNPEENSMKSIGKYEE